MNGTASAKCPVCGTPISQTQYAEIQERIRTEEQAKLAVHTEQLCAQHEAELKRATAEAVAKVQREAEQKLAQVLIKETQQTERILELESKETLLRAEAAKAQKQLRAQFDQELQAATKMAAAEARSDADQKLELAQAKEKQHTDRIRQLEANESTLRADAAKQQQHLRAQFDKDLQTATHKAAAEARQDAAERLAAAQLTETKQSERIAQLEASEATIRANASRAQEQMRIEFAKDLKAATDKAVDDARATVGAELSAKEAELRAATESHREELKRQRQILDEHRDLELQKVRNEQARENEALQKKVQELSRKLEQKTANELGEGPEIDLYQALHEAFDTYGDNIYRVKKGEPGADIIHEVMYVGQHCQTIVYDSKNHKQYRHSFVEKLLADKVNAKAEHAVLVTGAFPGGQRDLCIVDGVVLAKPSQAVTIATVLRDRIVNDHVRNLSLKDRAEKKERLYKLMTSPTFRQRMDTIERIVDELQEIDVKEANDHRKVWTARAAHYRTALKSVTDLVLDVDVILQGEGQADEAFAVTARGSATGTDGARIDDDV